MLIPRLKWFNKIVTAFKWISRKLGSSTRGPIEATGEEVYFLPGPTEAVI